MNLLTIQALEIQLQSSKDHLLAQSRNMTAKEIARTISFIESLTETIQQAKQGLI